MSFLEMMDTHVENAVNVVVIERIENGLSASARLDELGAFQHAELMGNGCLRQLQKICDVADAKLIFLECVEDADPRRIPEHLEKFGKVEKKLFFGHPSENVLHNVFVNAEKFAFFNWLFVVHIIILSW